uniref:BSD domain-containing protein n=1 Tax=Corethron hystrix TaxID=216773 RepID=A0A7S1FYW0_9STRA
MYPAVFRAYVDKVPLEMPEEAFWRRYLESEYFHRDRGVPGAATYGTKMRGSSQPKRTAGASGGAKAAGLDDMFSRYDREMKKEEEEAACAEREARRAERKRARRHKNAPRPTYHGEAGDARRMLSTSDRFDLVSTVAAERPLGMVSGHDLHPGAAAAANALPHSGRRGAGAVPTTTPVIGKYNRHWAFVLGETGAGGGAPVDAERVTERGAAMGEMEDLVAFAQEGDDEEQPDYEPAKSEGRSVVFRHFGGIGSRVRVEELVLKDASVYRRKDDAQTAAALDPETNASQMKRAYEMSKFVSSDFRKHVYGTDVTTEEILGGLYPGNRTNPPPSKHHFPNPALGKDLMTALTRKFMENEGGDARAEQFATNLDSDFRQKLDGHFRKSSELIKHFFGTRRLAEAAANGEGAAGEEKTLADRLMKIVKKMEDIYREIEAMRKGLPQDESGIKMGRVLLPIMNQLDWVFEIHRDSRRQGNSGFVTVNL